MARSPTFSVAYSGFVLGHSASALSGPRAYSTTTSSSSNVGTYATAVNASGETSTNYAITYIAGPMVVTAAPLTITASGTQVYGGSPTYSAAYNGFVLGQGASALSGTLAYTTTTSSGSNVGTYATAVNASGETSTNYAITYVAGPMVVTAAPLTITASGSQVYGGSPTFSAAYNGFVLGQGAGVLSGTLAYTTTTSSSSDVGTYATAVSASGLTSTNYAITYVAGPMVVTAAPLTITASGAQVYGGSPSFSVAYSGFVLGQDASALNGSLAYSTTTTSSSNVGTYASVVNASGETSTNYAITYIAGPMVVTAAPLTITGSGTQVYGGSPTFSVAYSGFVLGQGASALSGTLAYSTTTSSSSNVGTYATAVNANGLTSTNYAITYVAGPMVVTAAPLTITGSGTQVYGGSPTFSVAYSGFVLGQGASALSGTPAYSTSTSSSSNVGTYATAVSASGLASTNYQPITYVAGPMVVTTAPLSIKASGSQIYGGSPTYSVVYSGFVLSQSASALSGTLSYTTTTSSSSNVGTYATAVNASGLTSTNYADHSDAAGHDGSSPRRAR